MINMVPTIGKYWTLVVASEKNRNRDGSDLLDALNWVGVSPDRGMDSEAAITTDKGWTPPALLRVTGWAEHWPEV